MQLLMADRPISLDGTTPPTPTPNSSASDWFVVVGPSYIFLFLNPILPKIKLVFYVESFHHKWDSCDSAFCDGSPLDFCSHSVCFLGLVFVVNLVDSVIAAVMLATVSWSFSSSLDTTLPGLGGFSESLPNLLMEQTEST